MLSQVQAWSFASWAQVTFLFSCNPNTPKVSTHVFKSCSFLLFVLFYSFIFLFLCFAFMCSKQIQEDAAVRHDLSQKFLHLKMTFIVLSFMQSDWYGRITHSATS